MIDPKQITLNHMTLNQTEETRLVVAPDINITSFDMTEDGTFVIRGVVSKPDGTASGALDRAVKRKVRIANMLEEVHVRKDGEITYTGDCNPKYIFDELSIVNGEIIGQAYAPLSYVGLKKGTHAEVVRGRAWYNEKALPELGWIVAVKNGDDGEPIYIRLELK